MVDGSEACARDICAYLLAAGSCFVAQNERDVKQLFYRDIFFAAGLENYLAFGTCLFVFNEF